MIELLYPHLHSVFRFRFLWLPFFFGIIGSIIGPMSLAPLHPFPSHFSYLREAPSLPYISLNPYDDSTLAWFWCLLLSIPLFHIELCLILSRWIYQQHNTCIMKLHRPLPTSISPNMYILVQRWKISCQPPAWRTSFLVGRQKSMAQVAVSHLCHAPRCPGDMPGI